MTVVFYVVSSIKFLPSWIVVSVSWWAGLHYLKNNQMFKKHCAHVFQPTHVVVSCHETLVVYEALIGNISHVNQINSRCCKWRFREEGTSGAVVGSIMVIFQNVLRYVTSGLSNGFHSQVLFFEIMFWEITWSWNFGLGFLITLDGENNVVLVLKYPL